MNCLTCKPIWKRIQWSLTACCRAVRSPNLLVELWRKCLQSSTSPQKADARLSQHPWESGNTHREHFHRVILILEQDLAGWPCEERWLDKLNRAVQRLCVRLIGYTQYEPWKIWQKSSHWPLGGADALYMSWSNHGSEGGKMGGRDLLKTFTPSCLNIFIWFFLVNDFSSILTIIQPPGSKTEKNNILLHFSHWRQREGMQGETDCSERRKGEKRIYGNVLKITPWYASDGEVRKLSMMCLVLEQNHSFNFIPSGTFESSCCCSYLCVQGMWPTTTIYHWGSFKICKEWRNIHLPAVYNPDRTLKQSLKSF